MSDASAPDDFRLGWSFPTWGTVSGILFLLAMTSGLGALVGFFVAYGGMMVAIPAMLVGGEKAGPMFAIGFGVVLAVSILTKWLFAVAFAPTQGIRNFSLNMFVLSGFVIAGLAVSVKTMIDAWH